MTDIARWVETWRELGVGDSPTLRRLYSDVLGRYSEPHRHYHAYQHLAECFEKVQDIISLAEHPAEVNVGLWFHDVIYDTQRHDNEERSADWARTRHAAEPVGIDAEVLVDADLSILGAQSARFQEYEAQVRSEYGWVPDAMFRPTRAKILKEFLGRPHLFCTARFRERYEAQARRNLEHSLVNLEGLGAAGV